LSGKLDVYPQGQGASAEGRTVGASLQAASGSLEESDPKTWGGNHGRTGRDCRRSPI